MEEWQVKHINSNLPKLIQIIRCKVSFYSYFIQQNIFSHEDVEELKAATTETSRNYDLLLKLSQRKNSYEHLTMALWNTHQTGAFVIIFGAWKDNGLQYPMNHFKLCLSNVVRCEDSQLLYLAEQEIPLFPVNWYGQKSTIGNIWGTDDMHQLMQILRESSDNLESFSVGLDSSSCTTSNYITRTLCKKYYLDPNLVGESNLIDIIALYVPDQNEDVPGGPWIKPHDLSQITGDTLTVRHVLLDNPEDFEIIFPANYSKNIHFLYYHDRRFCWKYSQGDATNIQNHLLSSKKFYTEKIIFDKLAKENFCWPVCICGEAGSGRLSLLRKLANDLGRQAPGKRLVYFSKFRDVLRDLPNPPTEADIRKLFVTKLTKSNSEISIRILSHLIEQRRVTLHLFLGSFEKLEKSERKLAKELLRLLKVIRRSIRLVMTVNEEVKKSVQTILGVPVFYLQDFSFEEQQTYFKSCFVNTANRMHRQYIESTLTKLNASNHVESAFLGKPLYLHVLAEVIKTNGFQILNHQMLAFILYKKLEEMRFANNLIIIKNNISIADIFNCRFPCCNKRTFKSVLSELAIQEVFPEFWKKFAHCDTKHLDKLKKAALLLNCIRTEEVFEHTTIAEFIVARSVVEAISDVKTDISISRSNMLNLLFDYILGTKIELHELLPNHQCFYYKKMQKYVFRHKSLCNFLNGFLGDAYTDKKHQNSDSFVVQYFGSTERSNPKNLLRLISASVASEYHFLSVFFMDIFESVWAHTTKNLSPEAENTIFTSVKCSHIKAIKFCYTNLRHNFSQLLMEPYVNTNVTPIQVAVNEGNLIAVKNICEYFPFVEVTQKSLLHFLFTGTARFNSNNSKKFLENRLEILKFLLQKDENILLDKMQKDGGLPFLSTAIHLRILEELNILDKIDINETNYYKQTVLHKSVEPFGDYIIGLGEFCELVNFLQIYGFQKFSSCNSAKENILHLALRHIDLNEAVITKLVKLDVKIDAKNGRNETCLFVAVRHCRSLSCLDAILCQNPDLCATNESNQNILHVAARHSEYTTIDRIATRIKFKLGHDQFLDILNQKDIFSNTPLHYAMKRKEATEIQHFIIDSGADLNAVNSNGNCPLVEGYQNGNGLSVSIETVSKMQHSNRSLNINAEVASKCITAMLYNNQMKTRELKAQLYKHINMMVENGGEFTFSSEAGEIIKKSVKAMILQLSKNNRRLNERIWEDGNLCSVAKVCAYLLEDENVYDFVRLRQEMRSCSNNTLLFRTTSCFNQSSSLDKIIITHDVNLCYKRLRDCIGSLCKLYDESGVIDSEVDFIVQLVGQNRNFDKNKIVGRSRQNRTIHITSHEVANLPRNLFLNFEIVSDNITWKDLTMHTQHRLLMRRPAGYSIEDDLGFDITDYEKLGSEELTNLLKDSILNTSVLMALVYFSLLRNFTKLKLDLDRFQIKELYLIKVAVESQFPSLLPSLEPLLSSLAGDNSNVTKIHILMKKCVSQNILVEDDTRHVYKFKSNHKAQFLVGRLVSMVLKADVDQNQINCWFKDFFSLTKSKFEIYRTSGVYKDVQYYQFKHPVMVHAFNTCFDALDHNEVIRYFAGERAEHYISACITHNLHALITALVKRKNFDEKFCNENLMYSMIMHSSLSTIKLIVEMLFRSSKSSFSALLRNSTTRIWHVAGQRGNYQILDYIIHFDEECLPSITLLTEMLQHCVGNTLDKTLFELEERQYCIDLLQRKFNALYKDQTSIFEKILVEVDKIHLKLVIYLVKKGANLKQPDQDACNIAHRASVYYNPQEYLDFTRFIIDQGHGEIFRDRNVEQKSAIRFVLSYLKKPKNKTDPEEEICQILRLLSEKAGISFNKRNDFHESILECAEREGRSEQVIQVIKRKNGIEGLVESGVYAGCSTNQDYFLRNSV